MKVKPHMNRHDKQIPKVTDYAVTIYHMAIINCHLKIRKAVDALLQAVRYSLLAKLI